MKLFLSSFSYLKCISLPSVSIYSTHPACKPEILDAVLTSTSKHCPSIVSLNISQILPLLPIPLATALVEALIISHLYYSNALLIDLSISIACPSSTDSWIMTLPYLPSFLLPVVYASLSQDVSAWPTNVSSPDTSFTSCHFSVSALHFNNTQLPACLLRSLAPFCLVGF